MTAPAVAGLILSGGASSRMGTPKALLEIHGTTFLENLIGVLSTVCQPVMVVLGYESQRIRTGISASVRAQFAVNPEPERGMLSSLQCGLNEVPVSAEAVIFTPVDYPNIRSGTIQELALAFACRRSPVTIPRYRGERGHPVCLARSVIDEMLDLPASAQARDLIRSYRDQTCFVDVDDPGILFDIDLPQDYRSLRAAISARGAA